MTDREKLITLIASGVACPDDRDPFGEYCDSCRYEKSADCSNERLADHLIAHGVTVQGWISVKDRLPGDSTTVNLYTRSRIVGTGFYDKYTKNWVQYYSGGAICVDVTHWQPLPQPPKGGAPNG